MPRPNLFKLAQFAASIALIFLALHFAGLLDSDGWGVIKTTFVSADILVLGLSLLFIPIMDVISTIKWRALSASRNIEVGFWRLLAFYFIGRFYNLILPSSVGGDLIRIAFLGRFSNRYADAAAIVFVERFTGVITLVGLAAIALIFAGFGVSTGTIALAIILATIGLVLLLWLLTSLHCLNAARRLIGQRSGTVHRIISRLERLQLAINKFRHQKRALLVALLNSLVFYAAAVVNVWVSVMVFDSSVSFAKMIVAVPIIMFIMNVPVSIGNVGVMEFGYTFVLMHFGVTGEAAIATALLMRLKLLLSGCLGGIMHALYGEMHLDKSDLQSLRGRMKSETRQS